MMYVAMEFLFLDRAEARLHALGKGDRHLGRCRRQIAIEWIGPLQIRHEQRPPDL